MTNKRSSSEDAPLLKKEREFGLLLFRQDVSQTDAFIRTHGRRTSPTATSAAASRLANSPRVQNFLDRLRMEADALIEADEIYVPGEQRPEHPDKGAILDHIQSRQILASIALDEFKPPSARIQAILADARLGGYLEPKEEKPVSDPEQVLDRLTSPTGLAALRRLAASRPEIGSALSLDNVTS